MSKGLPPYTTLPPDYNLSEQMNTVMATAPTAPTAPTGLPLYPQDIMTSQPLPGVPPATTTQHTVVISAPAHNPQVGPKAMRMSCPSCRVDIKSKVKHAATSHTHCMAIFMCLFCCWPCVCLPYCMDSCQNANHYCPNCNAFIGTYQS